MKKQQLNALAYSLCQFLGARNNDIGSYWGIGILCAISKNEQKPNIAFTISPGESIQIDGFEISESKRVTDKLVKFRLDSIKGVLSFIDDGRYPHEAKRFICGIEIVIMQGGRSGLGKMEVNCWPHDPLQERPRHYATPLSKLQWQRLKNS